jgi:hypothetical protein
MRAGIYPAVPLCSALFSGFYLYHFIIPYNSLVRKQEPRTNGLLKTSSQEMAELGFTPKACTDHLGRWPLSYRDIKIHNLMNVHIAFLPLHVHF